MAAIHELINSRIHDTSRFLDSEEFVSLESRVNRMKSIKEMKETEGWKALTDQMREHIKTLQNDMLMAEEPEDPVTAKVWRAERRVFAKAMILLIDQAEALVQDGEIALEEIEGRLSIE